VRKLPADLTNATQFYPKKLAKNCTAYPEPKAGQLNAGLGVSQPLNRFGLSYEMFSIEAQI